MNQRRAVGRARSTDSTSSPVIVRRHRPDYRIVMYMGLLMLLGLIIMYAIGPQRANVLNNATGTEFGSTYFFMKQAASLLLAAASFAGMALLPYGFLKQHALKLLMFGFISCALLAVAGWLNLGIAQCSLGACRWFNLAPFGTLQPAEFLKFGILIFSAGFLGMRMQQGLINDVHKTLIPLGVVILVAVIFIIGIQKDMGTGIAMLSIVASMIVVAGVNKRIGVIIAAVLLALGVLLIAVAPHRIERVTTFFAGDSGIQNDANYHINHAKIAIGSGGLTGVGIGNSVQATGYLPEAINDSVFAIMGETFGFIGLLAIISLFTALLFRLIRTADLLVEPWMKLAAAGVFGWLAAHVILNIAAMIGIFPLTGITLPLLSFGGTSMIFIAGALGLVFQLSRYTAHKSTHKEVRYEDSSSRRRVGGPRYASRRRN